jgi:integrase
VAREDSPYIVGDFWLDKRRDGLSPDIWQIARYDGRSRSVRYQSTRRRTLEDAKPVIDAHHARETAKRPQDARDALVVPLLLLYWQEHGQNAVRPDSIAGSLRVFIAFLEQDTATLAVRVDHLNPLLFDRFRQWRMAPHSYSIDWLGSTFTHESKGVNGESVNRNLNDVRAALAHQARNGRLPYAPIVPAVKAELRSPPRERVLTTAELGAIYGFAREDKPTFRFLALILATAVRSEAAAAMDPKAQWMPDAKLIDLHPAKWPRTKKHNPVVPVIEPFAVVLKDWVAAEDAPVVSRIRAWRTLKRALGLSADVHAKTIRHTIATRLRGMGVPAAEVSGLLGHAAFKGTTAIYAKYDPAYLGKAKRALTKIWNEVMAAADKWAAAHMRSKVGNGATTVVRREGL